MILELDHIRAYYTAKYDNLGMGIGKGDKIARIIAESWVEAGRRIVVIWGPPGSGKSSILNQYDGENILVIETTGLSASLNVTLRKLPTDKVDFICHTAAPAICKARVLRRRNHPMGDNGAYLVSVIDRWFKTPKSKMLG